MVMTQTIISARNVYHLRKTAVTQSAAETTNRPTYHQALRPGVMYSSACQVISC